MATVTYGYKPLFGETTVNSTTFANQTNADITLLDDGRFVVVWQSDEGTSSTAQDLYGVVLNADGTAATSEFSVQANPGDFEENATVTTLSDGTYAIAYQDSLQNLNTINTRGEGGGLDVNIMTSSPSTDLPSGVSINPEAEADDQLQPDIAANGAGRYAVAFIDQLASSTRDNVLNIIIFENGNTAPLQSFEIVSPGESNIIQPSVTALSDDNFVVTWVQDDDLDSSETDWNVYHQRISANGNAIGGAVLVNDEPDDQFFPVVTALEDGGYVIAWMDTINDSRSDTEIQYAIYNNDGGPRVSGTVVSSTDIRVDDISVSAVSEGTFVVTFTERTISETNSVQRVVKAQAITNDGIKLGDAFTIDDQSGRSGDTRDSSVVGIDNGKFAVVYTDRLGNDIDDSGTHIAFKGYTLTRTTEGDATAETLTGDDLSDVIFGNAGKDRLEGFGGDDDLLGGSGNDTLLGGAGDDELFGGSEDDVLLGNGGNDMLIGDEGVDTLVGGGGADRLFGVGGDDRLVIDTADEIFDGGAGNDSAFLSQAGVFEAAATNIETWVGSAGSDLIQNSGSAAFSVFGLGGNDTLRGGSAADLLIGGTGVDVLVGNGGKDQLNGSQGTDFLNGGAGNDLLIGGADAGDLFQFSAGGGGDQILDWQDGLDKLDFRNNSTVNSIDDVNIVKSGNTGFVFYGGGTADFAVVYGAFANGNVLDANDIFFV